jgi:hypothetical protein
LDASASRANWTSSHTSPAEQWFKVGLTDGSELGLGVDGANDSSVEKEAESEHTSSLPNVISFEDVTFPVLSKTCVPL